MKLKVEYTPQTVETEVLVKCCEHPDQRTKQLLERLKSHSVEFSADRGGKVYKIALSDVYYFDCTDETVFCYLEQEVYKTSRKLYEWERFLVDTPFIRIGKATILNTDKLDFVRPLLSGKMEAVLVNGEKQIISRHYLPGFRQKFGI